MIAVHFVAATKVFADTNINHLAKSKIESVSAVCSALHFISSIVKATYAEVKAKATSHIDTQSRENTHIDTCMFVGSGIAFIGMVTTGVIKICLGKPIECFAPAYEMCITGKWAN